MKIALVLTLAALPLALAGQTPPRPAATVPDGETLAPGPRLQIGLADEIVVGGHKVRTAALPPGLELDRKFGLIVNRGMRVSLLFYQPGVRADCARVVRTPGGDLLAALVAGIGHYAPREWAYHEKRNDLVALRSSDGGNTWRGPSILFPVPYSLHGMIPFIPRGSKRIYCFGTEPIPELREERENAPIAFRHSDDDGHTWSAPTLIRPVNDPEFRGMSLMPMTETASGAWILGSHASVWDPGSNDYEKWVGKKIGMLHSRQYLLRSEDQGRTWTVIPKARPGGWYVPEFDRMDEGRPIALADGSVLAVLRTAEGHLWEARSTDDGRTWTDPRPTPIVHPDAPPMVFLLSDRKTLLVLHHNEYDPAIPHAPAATRNELWASLSRDNGVSWSEPRLVMATACKSRTTQISYADVIAEDGNIQLFVTYGWKQTLQVRFRESEIAAMPTRAHL